MLQKEPFDLISVVIKIYNAIESLFLEIGIGIKNHTIPLNRCCASSVFLGAFVILRYDAFLFKWCRIAWLYPFYPPLYRTYECILILSPFFLWSCIQIYKKNQLIRRLTQTFTEAGLVTRAGRLPGYVSDVALDHDLRKLTLTAVGIPLVDFQKASPSLSASLQSHIEEVRANIEKGTVDFFYANRALQTIFNYDPDEPLPPFTFIVGQTRRGYLTASLKETPHFLIAGITNGGKSTFVRQMLATLYLRNKNLELDLIDLKGGMEANFFADLPRVRIYSTPPSALNALKNAESEVLKRIALFSLNKAHDMDSFFSLDSEKIKYPAGVTANKKLNRKVVVVDEAAVVFLGGGQLGAKEVQEAKRAASQIAALGRAVGVHLVVATQRPDRNAVDPLIKTHLLGRLCLRMADNASSMTILDSVRAADLPKTPGRAIWRSGMDLVEVQTPNLPKEQFDALLASYRSEKTETKSIKSEEKNCAEDLSQNDLTSSGAVSLEQLQSTQST